MKLFSLAAPLLWVCIFFPAGTSSAQALTKDLPSFNKVIASPLVELVLEQGDNEQVRIDYQGVEPEKIHYQVSGKTLRIYLDDAKMSVKTHKYKRDGVQYQVPVYDKSVRVIAYVTYRQLKTIEKRGEEDVICQDSLIHDKLTIRLFGESRARFDYVQANHLKVVLFGENQLAIHSGQARRQRYRSFGENTIYTHQVAGKITSTSLFGNSQLHLNASDKLRITAFGEAQVSYSGDAHLTRRLVLGDATIHRVER